MNWRAAVFGSMVLCASAYAQQAATTTKSERSVIEKVKKVSVSEIDRDLPDVSLEFFLKYESEGAPIRWEVNDCGEQTGASSNAEVPMCVEADIGVKQGDLAVVIAVGTYRKGIEGRPKLFSATITDCDGLVRTIRKLGDLPVALHGIRPRRKRIGNPDEAGSPA